MKLTIHCGAHRTGTTSIQKVIRRNKPTWEKYGLRAFAQNDDATKSLHELRRTAAIDEPGDAVKLFEIFGADNVFVSDENLLCVSHDAVKGGLYGSVDNSMRFFNWLNTHCELSIVFCIRNTPSWIESIYLKYFSVYSQKGQLPLSFKAFLKAKGLDTSSEISWVPLIEKMAEIVGASRLRIVSFDRLKAGLASYTADVMQLPLITDNIAEILIDFEPANRSPGATYIKMFNKIHPLVLKARHIELARILMNNVGTLDKPPPFLDNSDRDRLEKGYKQDMSDIVGRVGCECLFGSPQV